MRSVLITGVQGAGKSALSRRSAQTLGIANWDYADLMLQVAPDIQHKDELAQLSPQQRDLIYRKVEVLLARLFEPGDGSEACVLLENHLSIVENSQLRTFPHADCRRYNPAGLVVIEAEPGRILARRRHDPDRYRHIGTADEVRCQQERNRSEATAIAAYLAIPSAFVNNDDLGCATAGLVTWLRQVTL